MKIVLGTKSKYKKAFLQKKLKDKFENFTIIQTDVNSGVSEQPLTQAETITGATNRAFAAFGKVKNADLSFGMEGGMQVVNSHFYYFTVVCLYDGDKSYLGLSDSIPLPKEVSELVYKGGYVGHTIRDYLKKHMNDQKLQTLIQPIVDRSFFFDKAIDNVFLIYENKNHF